MVMERFGRSDHETGVQDIQMYKMDSDMRCAEAYICTKQQVFV